MSLELFRDIATVSRSLAEWLDPTEEITKPKETKSETLPAPIPQKSDGFEAEAVSAEKVSKQSAPSNQSGLGSIDIGEENSADVQAGIDVLNGEQGKLIGDLNGQLQDLAARVAARAKGDNGVVEPDFKELERQAMINKWEEIKIDNQAKYLAAILAGIKASQMLSKSAG
jgi:hypothetical protein